MDNEILKAYVAGYFDGEGCITTSGKSFRATVSSTDYRELEFLKNSIGGVINNQYLPKNEKWSMAWKWVMSPKKKLYNFLVDIEPYLITKKEQAREVINYFDEIGFAKAVPNKFNTEKYEQTKLALKKLKKHLPN